MVSGRLVLSSCTAVWMTCFVSRSLMRNQFDAIKCLSRRVEHCQGRFSYLPRSSSCIIRYLVNTDTHDCPRRADSGEARPVPGTLLDRQKEGRWVRLKQGLVILLTLALCLVIAGETAAFRGGSTSMRCGTLLVSLGDTKLETLLKCGEPVWRETLADGYCPGSLPAQGRQKVQNLFGVFRRMDLQFRSAAIHAHTPVSKRQADGH